MTEKTIDEDVDNEFGVEEVRSKSYSHMELVLNTEYAKRVYKRLYKHMRHNLDVSMQVVRRTRMPGAPEASKKLINEEFDKVANIIKKDMDLAKHQVKEFALGKQLKDIEHVHTETLDAKYDTPYAKKLLGLIKQFDDLTIILNLLYMEGIIEESHSVDRCYEIQQLIWRYSDFLSHHTVRVQEGAKHEMLRRKNKTAEKKAAQQRRHQAKQEKLAAKKEAAHA